MSNDKLRKEVIKEQLLKTQKLAVGSALVIEYYEKLVEKEDDEQEKGKLGMKIGQMVESNKFNIGFITYLESLK